MDNFLFHEIGEKEREEIRKQAKKIMDDFSEKLEGVKLDYLDFGVVRDFSERDENLGENDENFDKGIMFENASDKNKDFIIAEKGGWEK